jgi:dTDP-4-amino-4,6-dideoxygalactose transaminase
MADMFMEKIEFLRPKLPKYSEYLPYLKLIDENNKYSNFGPINEKLEKTLLDEYFNNTGSLTTVSNCTLGLTLAISSSIKKGGKYAVMPSFTFAATPLAAQWCGLEPFFIDVDAKHWSIDLKVLNEVIERLGDDLAVIVPYVTFGQWVNLEQYKNLSDKNIPVVIDAASGFGGLNKDGKSLDGGFRGAIAYSCHATKPFGIGEGGIVYSENKDIVERVKNLSNFGFNQNRSCDHLGTNAKLPEISAAIALTTWSGFGEKLHRLNELYSMYIDEFSKFGLEDAGWQLQCNSGYVPHQFFPALSPHRLNADTIMNQLENKFNINTRAYYRPACHAQRQFWNCPRSEMRVTQDISRRIICFPLWVGMNREVIHYIVSSIYSLT